MILARKSIPFKVGTVIYGYLYGLQDEEVEKLDYGKKVAVVYHSMAYLRHDAGRLQPLLDFFPAIPLSTSPDMAKV